MNNPKKLTPYDCRCLYGTVSVVSPGQFPKLRRALAKAMYINPSNLNHRPAYHVPPGGFYWQLTADLRRITA